MPLPRTDDIDIENSLYRCKKCGAMDSSENPVCQRFDAEPGDVLTPEMVTWCQACFHAGMQRLLRAIFYDDSEVH